MQKMVSFEHLSVELSFYFLQFPLTMCAPPTPPPPLSTLVSSYPKFLQKTARQRPDSVLATLPKNQTLTWAQWGYMPLHSAPWAAGSVFVITIIFFCTLKHYGLLGVAAMWLRPSSWISTMTYIAPVAGSVFIASAMLWAVKHYSSHRL